MGILEKLKITPGPWYWTWSEEEGSLYPPSPDGIHAANEGILEYVPRNTTLLERHKDLIAAAPEMLHALINIGLYGALRHEQDWRKIEYVIEKATGMSWQEVKEIIEEE
jgi:hypothetical protein